MLFSPFSFYFLKIAKYLCYLLADHDGGRRDAARRDLRHHGRVGHTKVRHANHPQLRNGWMVVVFSAACLVLKF